MAFSDATEACEFARRVAKNSMSPYAVDELIHEVQLSEGSAVDDEVQLSEGSAVDEIVKEVQND